MPNETQRLEWAVACPLIVGVMEKWNWLVVFCFLKEENKTCQGYFIFSILICGTAACEDRHLPTVWIALCSCVFLFFVSSFSLVTFRAAFSYTQSFSSDLLSSSKQDSVETQVSFAFTMRESTLLTQYRPCPSASLQYSYPEMAFLSMLTQFINVLN